MLVSQFFLATLKEAPAEAELISHQLMLRAGMIRRLASGLYTWLPLGLRVLQNVIHVIREEMNRSGALEILMPSVQPMELWQESNRWEQYGGQLLKMNDRNQREFCFGPTHEEVITDIARRELHSYKQLPVTFYQIQTKFRDEIRPRFGIMRAREFLMKDGYSFHLTQDSLQETYQIMFDTYHRIFNRLGLIFKAVLADTGNIGGSYSHEFQVLADSGEDVIVYSDGSDYVANLEKASAAPPQQPRTAPTHELKKIPTPGLTTIAALTDQLGIPATQFIKTLLVEGAQVPLVALLLRGDHELNITKAEKLPQVAIPLKLASREQIIKIIGAEPGSIGPIGLNIPMIVDQDAAILSDFACGANETGYHFLYANWERDLPLPSIAELRNVVAGDPSPDGKGRLALARGIEVGHIFQLGDRYTEPMHATILNESGQTQPLIMGTYGIGVSRIVAAAIEQNHDQYGIIWPEAIAPFTIAIVPLNFHKSPRVKETSMNLYHQLKHAGHSVLLDDRHERPGVMFADMDLIGIPHRIVISERGLDQNTIEYKARTSKEAQHLSIEALFTHLAFLKTTTTEMTVQ